MKGVKIVDPVRLSQSILEQGGGGGEIGVREGARETVPLQHVQIKT